MSSLAEEPETNRDLQQELTELEYFATQRKLTSDEQKRLHELHKIRDQIAEKNLQEASKKTSDMPVVSSDDSP